MEKELIIVYLTLLKREPTSNELNSYLPNLINGTISMNTVSDVIRASNEYKALQSRLGVEYNSAENAMTVNVSTTDESLPYDGVIVSNGKLCVKSARRPYDLEYSVITTVYNTKELSANNTNVMHGFKYTGIRLFEAQTNKVQLSNLRQTLNMYTAMLTHSYEAKSSVNGTVVRVKHEMQALQQYPYCFLQRYHVENPSDSEIEFDVYHQMDPSGENLTRIERSMNVVSETSFFSAEGYDAKVDATLAANNTYLYDNMAVVGLPEVTAEGLYRMRVRVGANHTGIMSVVTGMMTTQDFSYPMRELTRILLTIKDYNLRVDHNVKWVEIWNTANVLITKRTDIESAELPSATRMVETLQRNIRYSLYNIFTIIRDDVNVDMNVLNLSAIDMKGDIYWDAEMFLVPILTILRPECARVLLNFRHQQMQFALSVASVFKNRGSQYIYKEDISNYKDMFWAPSKPATVFNTALIGINVWNFYKTTLDRYWLTSKGFTMLENSMRFFQSLFVEGGAMKTVVSLSGYEEENNALSRYLGISVIRHYMEACYELSIPVPEDVIDLYNEVKHSMITLDRQVSLETDRVDLPANVDVLFGERGELVLSDRGTGVALGSKLGGYVDQKLLVDDSAEYSFHVGTGVYIKFYDLEGAEILDNPGGAALYSTSYGFSEGVVKIAGSRLCSYENALNKKYAHGKEAFVRELPTEISNIVSRPAFDDRKLLLEINLMFMRYYSKLLFQSINPMEKANVIENNYIYHKKGDMTLQDRFVENHLDGLLAQEVGLNAKKRYYINRFEDTLDDIFHESSALVTRPWGNHDQHVLFIFNVLTALLKVRAKGQISDKRFYSENLQTEPDKGGFCLPRYWQYVTLKYNGKRVVISNDFIFDSNDTPLYESELI